MSPEHFLSGEDLLFDLRIMDVLQFECHEETQQLDLLDVLAGCNAPSQEVSFEELHCSACNMILGVRFVLQHSKLLAHVDQY